MNPQNSILNENNPNAPYQNIPIRCLGLKTRLLLSAYLNPTKVLLSEDGHHRDWRGVFHFTGLPRPYANLVSSNHDHFGELLKLWIEEDKENPGTLAQLQNILGIIDRWDVLDDTSEMFEQDATEYLIQKAKVNQHIANIAPEIQQTVSEKVPSKTSETNCLTIDDVQRAQQGLPLQQYDTFVLFADEDIDFAVKMIEKIEEDFRLKVCVKERDLLAGLNFEHDVILNLLTNRCKHLVVILSPAFISSPANEFIANLAQSLGMVQRCRKIIPCLYQPCELPKAFHYMHMLDYQRSSRFNNFWQKLNKSLIEENDSMRSPSSRMVPSITLTDADSPIMSGPTNSSYNPIESSTPEYNPIQEISMNTFLSNRLLHVETSPQISRSSPSSPNLLRKFLHMDTKKTSASTLSLNTMDYHRTATSNNNIASIDGLNTNKKRRWYKKFLSPSASSAAILSTSNHCQTLTGSDTELTHNNNNRNQNINTHKEKKKKWFRKKVASHS